MAKLIRARVVCAQYGNHFHGEIVDVEERELLRVGADGLLSLEEEERRREEAKRPLAEADPDAQRRKDAERAWRELARRSDSIMAQKRVEEAQKLVATAQGVTKPAQARG